MMGARLRLEGTTVDALTSDRLLDEWRPRVHEIGTTDIGALAVVGLHHHRDGSCTTIVGTQVIDGGETPVSITIADSALLTISVEINHERAIEALRNAATVLEAGETEPETRVAINCRAVADLLEVHDATGLNLTKFGDVETFVNLILDDYGFPPVADNHA